jgi:hypothetical protein
MNFPVGSSAVKNHRPSAVAGSGVWAFTAAGRKRIPTSSGPTPGLSQRVLLSMLHTSRVNYVWETLIVGILIVGISNQCQARPKLSVLLREKKRSHSATREKAFGVATDMGENNARVK